MALELRPPTHMQGWTAPESKRNAVRAKVSCVWFARNFLAMPGSEQQEGGHYRAIML